MMPQTLLTHDRQDLAVEVANNYSNRGAEEALAQLRHSIEQRVEDLENFYYENDMGNRNLARTTSTLTLFAFLR